MPKKPDRSTIRQMLDDIAAVTRSFFYEDPDPVAGPVEVFRMPEGDMSGIHFTDLSGAEKWQALGDYTQWQKWEDRGISYSQLNQTFGNVVAGKPRDEWLEGTGLDAGRNLTLEKLKALGQEIANDEALAKAEYEQRRRVEKFGSIEQEAAKQQSMSKDRDMER